MAEIKLSNQRYEEIKKIVVEMFVKYKVSCIPINGFEIASKMGIKVIPYSAYPQSKQDLFRKKSEDGFSVEKDTGNWYIFYNDEKDYRRRNNTIMHEIGHIVLDHTEDSELAEKEVNFFAKYALVPPVLVHKFRVQSHFQIVYLFEVSFEAAKYAFDYYKTWLEYGGSRYKQYELITLELFKNAS